MSRNINVCVNSQLFQNINGFDNIDIANIESLVNYSASAILVDNLNFLDSKNPNAVLGVLLQKMAVGSQMVLRFINPKLLAKKYVENSISDEDFLTYVSNIKYALTIEHIYNILDSNFAIDKIDESEFINMVKIIRVDIK